MVILDLVAFPLVLYYIYIYYPSYKRLELLHNIRVYNFGIVGEARHKLVITKFWL